MAGPADRSRRLLAICAAAPSLAAVAFCGAIVVTAAAGGTPPFWRGGSPLTLSEAAALHDQGDLVRMIASGSDPNVAYPLRPGVAAVSSLTPLEAAVATRRAEIIDLLMAHGATVNTDSWRRLHCLALSTGTADVVETVDRYKPAGAATACEGISLPF